MDNFLAKYFQQYGSIKGIEKPVPEVLGCSYWDGVIITAVDDEQKRVYEKQLEQKLLRKELPLSVPIHVIADPEGPKLGNGGSTLACVQFLSDKYGDTLFDMKILLLHAGGQSQRMPSASVLGKIFSPIPKGKDSMYQMLDIKLAMYMPLIPLMGPGIFVACADDFLVYDIGESQDGVTFGEVGFTALAHPSPVSVGTGHGVYVLKDSSSVNPTLTIQVHSCLQVLQKPSEAVMYEKGAVLDGKNFSFPPGVHIKDKFAYTDSSFFFAHDVTKKFLTYLKQSGMVTCEIDAYGDFLQALGPLANSDYTRNVGNVSTVTDNLLNTRMAMFNCLQKTKLTLLLMNASKFIHVGTTKEYIRHFNSDHEFQKEMGLSKDVFNVWEEKDHSGSKKARLSDTSLGCVMHSVLSAESFISESAVVEYCRFKVPVKVGQNCIISNCEFDPYTNLPSLDIPNNLFLHSIPLQSDGTTKYATVFFDIQDNLKKATADDKIESLPFLGKMVEDYIKLCQIDYTNTIPKTEYMKVKTNLWFARLFPVEDTMTDSLALTLKIILAVKENDSGSVVLTRKELVSMHDLLKRKDLDAMLEYRNKLYKEIKHV